MASGPAFDKIEFSLVRAFHTVITERSVSRAALRLHSSQPAVSAQLKRLRGLIGDPLLVRAGNGMAPTAVALSLIGAVVIGAGATLVSDLTLADGSRVAVGSADAAPSPPPSAERPRGPVRSGTGRMADSPPTTAKPHAFAPVFALLAPHMVELDRFLRGQLASFEPEIRAMADYCIDTSGKRIRPALVFLSGWRGPTVVTPDLVRVAAVVELVHLATLVHDDIMDEADVRLHLARQTGLPVGLVDLRALGAGQGAAALMIAVPAQLADRAAQILQIQFADFIPVQGNAARCG